MALLAYNSCPHLLGIGNKRDHIPAAEPSLVRGTEEVALYPTPYPYLCHLMSRNTL